MTPTRADRWRLPLICILALVGMYLPSSVAGAISEPLTMTGLTVTGLAMFALLVPAGAVASRWTVASALAMMTALTASTVLSPFAVISPGVFSLYLTLAMLVCINVPSPFESSWPRRTFVAISIITIVAGALTALNVVWIDRLQTSFFSAFRPTLVTSMVEDANKPVLTFATHSMAAFMFYLMFYMAWQTWRSTRRLGWLVLMAGHAGLLVALNSTTAWVLLIVALIQLLSSIALVRHRRLWLGLGTAVAVGALAWLVWSPAASAEVWRVRLFGNHDHGFIARYGPGGLLWVDIEYIKAWPWRPIGVTYSPNLYLADSGIVVAFVRGSLLLLATTYLALYGFFKTNLGGTATAAWLCLVTAAFDVGFMPLQYFRCLAFLPFLVLYLRWNQKPGDRVAGESRASMRDYAQLFWRRRIMVTVGIAVGAVLAGLWAWSRPPEYKALTVLGTEQSAAPLEARRAHVATLAAIVRQPDFIRQALGPDLAAAEALAGGARRFQDLALSVSGFDDGDRMAITVVLPNALTAAVVANRMADAILARSSEITSAPGRVPILSRMDRARPPSAPDRTVAWYVGFGAVAGLFAGCLAAVSRGSPRGIAADSRVL